MGLWTLKDGLKDGPQKSWYANGALKAEGMSRGGLPVGEGRDWYPDGQLKRLCVEGPVLHAAA